MIFYILLSNLIIYNIYSQCCSSIRCQRFFVFLIKNNVECVLVESTYSQQIFSSLCISQSWINAEGSVQGESRNEEGRSSFFYPRSWPTRNPMVVPFPVVLRFISAVFISYFSFCKMWTITFQWLKWSKQFVSYTYMYL